MSQELYDLEEEYKKLGQRIKDMQRDEWNKEREERRKNWEQTLTDRYLNNIIEFDGYGHSWSYLKVEQIDFEVANTPNRHGYIACGEKLEINSDGSTEIKPHVRIHMDFGKNYTVVTSKDIIKKFEDMSAKYVENMTLAINTIKGSYVFRGKNEVSNP